MTTPLIFIMGVQRSGTNALFRSLRGGAVAAYNEAHTSAVFESMLLRPEPEVRDVLSNHHGPVLIKAISEIKRRSLADVFDAYSAYDLKVVWIYRDPVNCYASHIERWTEFRGRESAFVESWCARNRLVLDMLPSHGDRIVLVRYRDLIEDIQLIKNVGNFLGIRGRYRFRTDSNKGREVLSETRVRTLIEGTQEVWDELQELRSFAPSPSSVWRQRLARIA